jgi:ATP-dependent RNA helicase RhlE
VALSFCGGDERTALRDIERLIRKSVQVVEDHPFVSNRGESDGKSGRQAGGDRGSAGGARGRRARGAASNRAPYARA